MSEAAEAAPAEAEDTAPEETVEDRATRSGWRPLDQFKGDPTKWIDAQSFVERGEQILPIVQAQNRKFEKALEAAQAEIGSLKKTLTKFADHNSKTEQRAYERALKDLKTELAQATQAGDIAAVDQITDDIADLKAEATGKKDDGPPPEIAEALAGFRARNAWFEKDRAMTGAAREIAQELSEAGVTGAEQLAEVEKRIREEFPHKFTNPRRDAAAAVEGAPSGQRRAGKTYSDLPPDAKAICDQFVKDIPGFTREKYIKDYFA